MISSQAGSHRTIGCIRAAVFAGIIMAWPASAGAQGAAITGDSIIRAMHDRYAATWYHTLTFSQKTTLRNPAGATVVETWREAAMFPGKLRVVMERATGPMVAMYSGDSLYFMKDDSVVNRIASRNILLIMGFDVYTQPAAQTLAQLKAEHYPMTPVREDTWEGRRVYVIGGSRGDERSNQIWIDKERLLFVRAIQPAGGSSSKFIDFRFADYVPVSGAWVSEHVETLLDGIVVQREEYSDVRPNAPLDSAQFAIPGSH